VNEVDFVAAKRVLAVLDFSFFEFLGQGVAFLVDGTRVSSLPSPRRCHCRRRRSCTQ
jgi:hypothetical protein